MMMMMTTTTTCKLYILLLAIFSLVTAYPDAPTILTVKQGVFCSPVERSWSHPEKSYIKLVPDAVASQKQIKGLIFHYYDIVNFTSVPILEVFAQLYPKEKKNLYGQMLKEDGSFNLDPAEGYNVDKSKIWSGSIDKEVKFEIPSTGIYCVYIAPPADTDEDEDQAQAQFKIPVVFKNSYGNLSYTYYLIYSLLKFSIPAGLVIFAGLFNYVLRFKIGKDFQNMDSLSVISKAVIFLVLCPLIAVSILQWFVFFLVNNFLETCQKSFIINFLSFVAQFASMSFHVFVAYMTLLFSMGFGVIYYYNGNSRNYRLFPQQSFRKISGFLFLNIVLLFVLLVMNSFIGSKNTNYLIGIGDSTVNNKNSFVGFITLLAGLFSLVWVILPMVFYFKTKKTIATFPPAPDAESTDKVVSAFRKSFLVIYVLPILTAILAGAIVGVLSAQYMLNMPQFPPNTERALVYASAQAMWIIENSLKSVMLPLFTTSLFYSFGFIIILFFIWIKDNNGLIVDRNANDPIEYANVPNFEISDGEDEENIRV
ncbi:hypothetical protein KGF56_001944 [Candida oxycetoniae]|uniref:Uncharacterized protein n=1 Tax=Candida oxycetoniae TaxID=497107 RepID=A0AAI9SY52_9ASCO|nr:uncharacterized protein KGF56_001944 [Candida oxycetoniae]KAI3405252.2 hypothetical protein KGF56_001944 [Candida oxycetoniae]